MIAWLATVALAADPALPWDDGFSAPPPDRASVRVNTAVAPHPTLLTFADLDVALPLGVLREGGVTLGLTASAGYVLGVVPAEGRSWHAHRRAGGGFWVVVTDRSRRARHAFGLTAHAGGGAWFRWSPEEASLYGALVYDASVPWDGPVAWRRGQVAWGVRTGVAADDTAGFVAPVLQAHVTVLPQVHERVSLAIGAQGGTLAHFQGLVGVRVRPTDALEVVVDVQLPVVGPTGVYAPIPTVGLGVVVRDGRPGPAPAVPWRPVPGGGTSGGGPR